jgi:hypothetical protein
MDDDVAELAARLLVVSYGTWEGNLASIKTMAVQQAFEVAEAFMAERDRRRAKPAPR